MIKAEFKSYGSYTTDSVSQWDLNQKLTISGLDIDVAPVLAFSCFGMYESIIVQSKLSDGVITCDVPNAILQFGKNLNVDLCSETGGQYKAFEKMIIPVNRRKKPSDYLFTDNVPLSTAESIKADLEKEINSNKTYTDKVKAELKNDNKTLNGRIDTILTGTVNTTKLVTVHSATIRNNSASDLTFKISSKDNETLKSIKDKSPTVIDTNVIARALDGVAINGASIPSSYNVESTNDEYVITVYSGSSSVVGQYVFMAVATIAYKDTATDISSAELKDIRTGANGTTYPTAGDAVRGQIGDLKKDLGFFVEPINIYNKNYKGKEKVDNLTISYENGYASNYDISNKGIISEGGGRYISYPIPVKGGNKINFFWGSKLDKYQMFFVNCYDKNMNFLERNAHSVITEYELPINTSYIRLLMQTSNWFTNPYPQVTYENSVTKYNGFFESCYFTDVVNVLILGAKGDGITDDTDIIQTALDMFDCVYLPPTEEGYMISKPLKIKKKGQKFYGGSHMPYYADIQDNIAKGSTIRPLPDFVGSAMIIIDHYAYGAELSNFAITWNKNYPDIQTNGIDVGYADDINNVSSLGFNILRDIFIYRLNGDGIVARYKNWDNHFNNVHVKKCSGNGFSIDCTDSVFVGCNASDNRKNGYQINKGACVFDSCKAFCNGTIGDVDTAGFLINGQHTRLNGCNSQQNYTNGIIINSTTNSISGLVIDGNGWNNPTNYLSALRINKSGNILSSIMIIPHWLGGCVKYGIDIGEGVENIDLVASITEAWDDWTKVKDADGNLIFEKFEEFVQVSPSTKFEGNRIIINCVQQTA